MTRPLLYSPALLAAACSGEPDAIDALLRVAQPNIRRYARRTCRTTTDVEDAVQEVLWILARRAPTLGALTSLSGWLFVIVHRLCLKFAQAATAPLSGFEVLPRRAIALMPTDDLRIDLGRAIDSLPDHYRAVLLLRDVEELTIDEIASHLAITRESAKARLHRARKLVREYLS